MFQQRSSREVTNAQFQKFVEATGYVTTAEEAPDWEELKKQLPPGTPKPDESALVAASLVFAPPARPEPLRDSSQWWGWTSGANWRQPQGSNRSITAKTPNPQDWSTPASAMWPINMIFC